MLACENCGRTTPDVQMREYQRDMAIDPAAANPVPGGKRVKKIAMCDGCDREARRPDTDAHNLVDKRLGIDL